MKRGRRSAPLPTLVLLLLAIPPARGDEASGSEPSAWETLREHIAVELVGRTIVHREEGDPDDPLVRDEVILRSELRYDADLFRARATPRFEDDDNHLTGAARPFLEDGLRRPRFTFEELFLTGLFGPVELTAGKRIYRWGRAELFSAVDRLCPRDLSDPLLSRRIGVVATDAYVHIGRHAYVEAVLIPWFTPHRLPSLRSRWAPLGDPDARTAHRALIHDLPPRTFRNAEAAARVGVDLGVLDVSLVYEHLLDRLPRGFIFLGRTPAGGASVAIEERYPRTHTFAGTVAGAVLGVSASAEVAFTAMEGDADEELISLVGHLERRFEALPVIGALTLGIEAAAWVPTRRAAFDPARLFTLRDLVGSDRALAGLIAMEPTSWLTLRAIAATSLESSPQGYLQARVSASYEVLELTVGVDGLFGPSDHLAGRWAGANDRLVAELRVRY